jgi:glycosyltransferase involved in cell wall biosynthesis
MTLPEHSIGIVVPTRNRPSNLAELLTSIERSTIHPAICVVVDASDFDYDLPACTFPLKFTKPCVRGQVKQRNYGIALLKSFGHINYALLLDDDILLDKDAINEALAGAARYANEDPRFVGFALNIVNIGNSSRLSRTLLFHPKKPGVVTRATFGSSLCNLDDDTECRWVLGGAALWNLNFLIQNPNNYPVEGKAFGEDFYYCSLVQAKARFAALAQAKCMHMDQYEINADNCRVSLREGISDTNVRLFIARRFPQYSITLTIFHILWVGFLGGVIGIFTGRCNTLMFGVGRLIGLVKRRLLLDTNSAQHAKEGLTNHANERN